MKMKELFALLIVAAMMVTILPLGVFAAADGWKSFTMILKKTPMVGPAHGGSNASDGVSILRIIPGRSLSSLYCKWAQFTACPIG